MVGKGNNKIVEQKNEILKGMIEVAYHPAILENQAMNLEDYTKVPLSRLPALGIALEPLAATFQNVISGGGPTSGLYKVVVPKGGHLASFKNGSGNLGTVLNANNQIAGQANLTPLVFDPATLFMALALANIDKKLDSIMEIQQEMLDFLIQKERSELKGDLNFLIDALNNYKYNWNNDQYKSNNHIKVLDIRQGAERKIDFYHQQIMLKINKKIFFQSEQEVMKKIRKIQTELKDYQLALYLYSFSSFLDVMLLENFASEYLDGIASKIEDYTFAYRELYTKCYNQLEEKSKASIQSRLLSGLASVNKFTGEVIEKVPVISNSQIDENLIATGDRLEKFGVKKNRSDDERIYRKTRYAYQSFY